MADEASSHEPLNRLNDEERTLLLGLAREALIAGVHGEPFPPIAEGRIPPRLLLPGATFVTLTKQNELRGCIGSLEAVRPLAEDVQVHAVAAALEDFRFPRVQPGEVSQISIEISRLTTPERINFVNEDELLSQIRIGIDGVILRKGIRRATFLPQVWEKVPEKEEFLGMLCQKMGAPRDCWRHKDMEIFTYQVEKFQEAKAE